VSRSFVYGNAEARAAVSTALAEAGESRVQLLAEQDRERESTWRERALNAEDALRVAHAEITTQRTRIGELLGQVRDLEAEWTQEAIARITTENTTLKQRVRQLTADNRTLEERLQAARSNNRFADRRIAQLEAELASPRSTREAELCQPCPWMPETPSNSPSCCSSSAAGWNPTTITSPRPWPGSSAARPTVPPH
jgi:chromosome segregation ATPase